MSATFLNGNKIILCSGNSLGLFKPPIYDSPACQLNEGPYIYATAFNGLIAAVAQNNTAGPPRTQFFLLLYQEKPGQNFVKSIEFPTKILGLRSTSIHLYVSISKTIQVFDLGSFRSIATINPASSSGFFVVNQQYIAYPDDSKSGRVFLATVFDFKVKHKIECHHSEIRTMKFSSNDSNSGPFLVTSSMKGTLIRLFDCSNGRLVTEFRRGYTQGNIIDIDMKFGILCVCTSSTIHVFVNLNSVNDQNSNESNNHSSFLSSVLSLVPSFGKNDAELENNQSVDGQEVHLTIAPNGVPLACAVNDFKNIKVISNNERMFMYEISDDFKKISLKNAVPLKIAKQK